MCPIYYLSTLLYHICLCVSLSLSLSLSISRVCPSLSLSLSSPLSLSSMCVPSLSISLSSLSSFRATRFAPAPLSPRLRPPPCCSLDVSFLFSFSSSCPPLPRRLSFSFRPYRPLTAIKWAHVIYCQGNVSRNAITGRHDLWREESNNAWSHILYHISFFLVVTLFSLSLSCSPEIQGEVRLL